MPKSILKTPGELSIRNKLKAILENRLDGATAIEDAAFVLALDILSNVEIAAGVKIKSLRYCFEGLKNRFPLMANIQSISDFIFTTIGESGIENLKTRLSRYRQDIETHRKHSIITAARQIRQYRTILTISNSTMVRQAILEASKQGWKGKILISESRPRNEGTIQAYTLAKAKIDIVLGVDALLQTFVSLCDAVFLGADCVTEIYHVNKIGTAIVVAEAERLRRPVYLVIDKAKLITSAKCQFTPDTNPPQEVSDRCSKHLTIINQYFEAVRPTASINYIYGQDIKDQKGILRILALKYR